MKRSLIFTLVVVFLFGFLLPLQLASAQEPIYHPDDKEGLRAFLRQASAIEGEINAQRLGLTVADTIDWQTDEAWVVKIRGLTWNNESPKRLIVIGTYPGGVENKNLGGSLDATRWKMLTELYCAYNQLSSLDVSANTELVALYCFENQLSSLDVSTNTALVSLWCSGNQLSSLDVNANTALKLLYCSDNQLSSLDVSANTALEILRCSRNQLSSLDVSANTALRNFQCSENQLSSLDVSGCTELRYLYCENNQLSSLNVSTNRKANLELICFNNHLLLSDLFAISEKFWGIRVLDYGKQSLHRQIAVVGVEVVFDPPQNIFNDVYTQFTVTKNGIAAPTSDYSVKEGKITFNKEGIYDVEMTNTEIISYIMGGSRDTPAGLTVEYEVRNPSDIGEIPQKNSLSAWAHNGLLHITGLSTGEVWSVYDITGALVYRTTAVGDKAEIPLNVRGMYILISENSSIKVLNH